MPSGLLSVEGRTASRELNFRVRRRLALSALGTRADEVDGFDGYAFTGIATQAS
jgi:hypothetical protein